MNHPDDIARHLDDLKDPERFTWLAGMVAAGNYAETDYRTAQDIARNHPRMNAPAWLAILTAEREYSINDYYARKNYKSLTPIQRARIDAAMLETWQEFADEETECEECGDTGYMVRSEEDELICTACNTIQS